MFGATNSYSSASGQYLVSRSLSSASKILLDNSVAAFLVKVSPRICSGRANPLATNQSTLTANSSVLPLPAPATTRAGESSGAFSIASIFSAANSKSLITLKISAAEYLADIAHRRS